MARIAKKTPRGGNDSARRRTSPPRRLDSHVVGGRDAWQSPFLPRHERDGEFGSRVAIPSEERGGPRRQHAKPATARRRSTVPDTPHATWPGAASSQFLQRYLGLVDSLARYQRNLCGSEIRSVCLESLWRNQARIEAADNPAAMARTICRRRVLDLHRRKRWSVPLQALAHEPASSGYEPEVLHDLGAVLTMLAATCTATQWRVLADMLLGVPRAETAATLAVSGPRVSQLRRELRALVRRLVGERESRGVLRRRSRARQEARR